MFDGMLGGAEEGMPMRAAGATSTTTGAAGPPADKTAGGLAEVQRVRQFFPETWIWEETLTDGDGEATIDVEAPDSITTWDLRAVAVSPGKG
jgi:CD109 antigen